ncbi:tail fiber domain-containing protein [Adhaeribacter aquaticus]|uniref:tail fiber domain-containing protein n=1 Tax=Adhaeribacter aquaticus TaxID=299567 RepID=UPI00047E38EF|nr:tail fiber domain-containing protein [Adhaeribacter aquaticus]
MSFQKKYVLIYFCVAAFFILRHQHSFAQNVISDDKLKVNVSTIHNSLEFINKLEPKRFDYKTRDYHNLQLPHGGHYGFITEEFKKVMPPSG